MEGAGGKKGDSVKTTRERDTQGTARRLAGAVLTSIGVITQCRSARQGRSPRYRAVTRGEAFQTQIGYTYMEKGKLKFFDTSRGFGFIEPVDGSDDVFLHANNISGMTSGEDLREGQTIEYEVEQTEKGLSALNAAPANEASGAL